MKIKKDKPILIFAVVLLFFVLSCTLICDAVVNSKQAEWAIIPDIRLVGEYKIADGEWQPIVEGEHISSTKGDVHLRGVIEILDPETKESCGTVEQGVLMLFSFNHISLSVTENGQVLHICDSENPDFGEDACGRTSMVVEYRGEDGYFEAIVSNRHRFGNETAVDELLSSMTLYASDYSEKIALRSGQVDRAVASVIIIAAFIVLGLALFSGLLHISSFKNYLIGGLLILAAGLFFLFTSRAFYFWNDNTIFNTMLTGLAAMTYVLFACMLMKEMFAEKAEKVADVVTLLYGVFIGVLIAVSLFSEIYFFDMSVLC